jgi:2-(1,2-epoxy-1,2-dihydrophenyl)acetyl-CoA isomerase
MTLRADSGCRTVVRTTEGPVEWWVDDGVGRIVLADPNGPNTISRQSSAALVHAIDAVIDASPRVVLLAARGPAFCVGGDIREFVAAGEHIADLVRELLPPLVPACLRLAQSPCPVVSAVQGPIGGAGIGLALAADLVIATPSMKLRTGYAAIGLSPDLGVSHFLRQRVGAARARRLLMMSETLDAKQCLSLGLIDELHEQASFDDAVHARVIQLRGAAPASMAAIKRLCATAPGTTLQDQLALERDELQRCASTADAMEGVAAFVERRSPVFRGLG